MLVMNVCAALLLLLYQSSKACGQIPQDYRDQPAQLRIQHLPLCCQTTTLSDPEALVNCVRSAANASNAVALRAKKTRSARFALVTYGSPNVWPYAAYAFAVNQAYAEHNGYLFNMADPTTSIYEPNDLRWNKVKIVENSLRTWAKSADYIAWLDADLVVLDVGMKLERIVQQDPNAEIWLSTEHAGSNSLSNTGFVIFRKSEFTSWFLSAWWTSGNRTAQSDQESFDQLYRQFALDHGAARKIVVLPPDVLNSYPPAATRQKPSSQVLHLMGDHTPFRARAFRAALSDICRVVGGDQLQSQEINTDGDITRTTGTTAARQGRLRRQLGVDQAHLLAWGLVEYKHDFERSVAAFEALLNSSRKAITGEAVGESAEGGVQLHAAYNNPSAAGHLTNAVVRYSELLEWVYKEWAVDEVQALRSGRKTTWEGELNNFFETDADAAAAAAAERGGGSRLGAHVHSGFDLRRRLFYLLVENLEASGSQSTSSDERTVILKDVLEQGQNLMKVAPTVDERRRVMDLLLRVSAELLEKVEPSRRRYVRNAIGDLQIDQAFLALSEGGNESSTSDGGVGDGDGVSSPSDAHKQRALVHLEEALRIKEDLALEQGDHALPQVLVIVADFYCSQLHRYRQSWAYFDRAVEIYERRMGAADHLLGTYLYLSAQARMAAGDDAAAVPLLRRAIGIMEVNGRVSRDLPQAEAFLTRAVVASGSAVNQSEEKDTKKQNKKKTKRKSKSKKESLSSGAVEL